MIKGLTKKKILYCVCSVFIGYMLGTTFVTPCQRKMFYKDANHEFTEIRGINNGTTKKHYEPATASNIFIGMMSAKKYLVSRVQEAVDAWLSRGDWKVQVFADPGDLRIITPEGFDFSIVNIHAVDDTAYPPQQKSFSLLRHMHDQHIDNFDWFVRIDDDLYLHSHRLHLLLSRMNASRPIYLGSPGFGIDEDDGIEEGMYFLMGGPGVIMSRGLLIELRKHMGYCVKHLFSPHEDVELGRCVWKYAKDAIIPVAWEVVELFVQQYDKKTGDTINIILDQLTQLQKEKPVTYHSLKKASLMNDLHTRLLQDDIMKLVEKTTSLKQEVLAMKTMLQLDKVYSLKPKTRNSEHLLMTSYERDDKKAADWPIKTTWNPTGKYPVQVESFIPWINFDKYYRFTLEIPSMGHSANERQVYTDLIERAEKGLIKLHCPGFPERSHFEHAYYQINPSRGVQYTLRHKAIVQGQDKYCRLKMVRSFGVEMVRDHTAGFSHQYNGDHFNQGLTLDQYLYKLGHIEQMPPKYPQLGEGDVDVDRLVFVVPLSGRYQALEKFMDGFKKSFLEPRTSKNPLEQNVLLVVVLFGGGGDEGEAMRRANKRLLLGYREEWGDDVIQCYEVNHDGVGGKAAFSRGAGLQFGSLVANENDVIFFIDVDMLVTSSLASQCRRNVVRGNRAWFPVPYSQYSPKKRCRSEEFDAEEKWDQVESNLDVGEEEGFWRSFGLGITCMYKSDFLNSGGFDLTIEGWGEEDVRLFVSTVQSKVDTFRANEPSLVHIYHDKTCDKTLEGDQATACQGTKVSHFASQRCLARKYDQKIFGN